MTPFGQRIRDLRRQRGVTLKEMAQGLQISSAYLSALEHGRRGRPSRVLVHQVCAYFNIIWDEAEELQQLARISHPKVSVDTSGLNPEATELANLISQKIRKLPQDKINSLLKILKDG